MIERVMCQLNDEEFQEYLNKTDQSELSKDIDSGKTVVVKMAKMLGKMEEKMDEYVRAEKDKSRQEKKETDKQKARDETADKKKGTVTVFILTPSGQRYEITISRSKTVGKLRSKLMDCAEGEFNGIKKKGDIHLVINGVTISNNPRTFIYNTDLEDGDIIEASVHLTENATQCDEEEEEEENHEVSANDED